LKNEFAQAALILEKRGGLQWLLVSLLVVLDGFSNEVFDGQFP